MDYVVIIAGGSGTRLWPLSVHGEPKQLLPLFEGKSLLQMAWERAAALVETNRILVCTSARYADSVRAQLPDLAPENLLGEPVGRDSLNAVAWPTAVIADRDDDAVVAIMTADQLIEPMDRFVAALTEGFRLAATDDQALIAFGVVPDEPHTGYGYLELSDDIDGFQRASLVKEFHEKPDLETATRYVASGRYWWNAGMFVWRASTFLAQYKQLLPGEYDKISALVEAPDKVEEIFGTLMKISVDYAIMEPVSRGEASAHVAAVGLDINWADVGSFESLYQAYSHDQDGNALAGRVVLSGSSNNLVVNRDDSVVAVLNMHDVAVIRTENATLVAPLSSSQDVRALVDQVVEEHGSHFG